MNSLIAMAKAFARDEDGITAIEYGLIAATMVTAVGVAFAFWEGLGLTLITLCSVVLLGESMTVKRALGLVCVLAGALLVHHGTGHGTGLETGHDKEDATAAIPPAARPASAAGGMSTQFREGERA